MLQEHTHEHYHDQIHKIRDFFSLRTGVLAYIPLVAVIIAMFFGASWLIFSATSDPARYQCYALVFWLGSGATHLLPSTQCEFLRDPQYHISFPQPPFHILPIEYPPLTLAMFSPALLAPLAYYQFAFALSMSLVALLVYWLLLRFGPQGGAAIFALYLFIGAIATTHNRFDLVPAALTLICLAAAERQRWTTAYIALAFGVLTKIYPLLLLPALFIAEQQAFGHLLPGAILARWRRARSIGHTCADAVNGVPTGHRWEVAINRTFVISAIGNVQRWRWRNCLLFLAVIAGVTGAFALLDAQGAVMSQLAYFANRPIQVEATGSTLLWLAHSLFPIDVRFTFGSYNVESALSGSVSLLCTFATLFGILYVLWRQVRGHLDLTQTFIALLLVFIATGKVFSPQYLIWLMPLLAYAGAFDAAWLLLWGAISLLTSYVYAFLYSHTEAANPGLLIKGIPGFFEIIGLRNALFVLLALAYLFNWFQLRQRKPVPRKTAHSSQPIEQTPGKIARI